MQLSQSLPPRCFGLDFVRLRQRREQRLRLGDLRHFGRRRKAFERGCEDGVGVGSVASRLIELGERKRRLQAETARALLPRNVNCSKKCGFRSPSVRAIRREQRLAQEPLQERVENPLPRISGQPLSLPYAAQRSIRFVLSELNFGEMSEEKGQIELMPLFRKGGEALTKLG